VTFLDNLQSHKGGLIKLKTQLYWNDGRGWDNNPGRICLLLDAEAVTTFTGTAAAAGITVSTVTASAAVPDYARIAAALLLVDGAPHWIWVGADDLELLQPGCNPSGGVV